MSTTTGNTSYKQQLRYFKITISNKYIKIIPLRESFKTQILIQKRSDKNVVYQQENQKSLNNNNKQVDTKYASLIMGVIIIDQQKFLVYAKNVYPQPILPKGYRVYQIADVQFIPFTHILSQTKQIIEIMQKEILSFSFYFSFERDLTLSFQQYYDENQQDNQSNLGMRSKDKYFWNYEMLSYLIGDRINNRIQKLDTAFNKKSNEYVQKPSNSDDQTNEYQNDKQRSQWCIPVVQGYYGNFQYYFKQNIKAEIFLISRRSKNRSGTRFYNRGIDQSGRCANFIETELVLLINDNLISVKFYTGSIPIFWQQTSQLSKVKLTRERELTLNPFRKHIKSLLKQSSSHIMLINLLQKKKQNQSLLIKQYQFLVQSFHEQFEQQLRYAYFDINQKQKTSQHQKIWEFIEQMHDITTNFKWFHVDLKNNVIYSTQKGSYRVSCLDCLARTNKLLQLLGFQSLFMMLEKFNLFSQNFKKLSLDILLKPDEKLDPFLRYYRNIWEEKSQFQSIIYAGSPSTLNKKTKFINHIGNTIISLQRYYNQKFLDQLKQKSLDILLYHKNYEPVFRSKHKLPLNISIMSWNVNAINPQNLQNIEKIIRSMKTAHTDLIVIGIQQMIELSTNNVMTDNTEESKESQKWHNLFEHYLNTKDSSSQNKRAHTVSESNSRFYNQRQQQHQRTRYEQDQHFQKRFTDQGHNEQFVFVQKVEMVGLFMIMFINKKWIHSINSLQKDIVKTGLKIGMSEKFGNKGGIVIRINIFETSLTFVCSHLAAHQNKIKERINDFIEIHKKGFQQNKESIQNQLEIQYSDYRFFFGDLNFRLEGQFQELKQIIEKHHDSSNLDEKLDSITQLLKKDQLTRLLSSYNNIQADENIQDHNEGESSCPQYLCMYTESPIQFFPTYKLDKSTGEYTLQKNRNPSYCDRILYSYTEDDQQLQIKTEMYSDIKITGSDHRPVIGRYRVNILKDNRKNSNSIIIEEESEELSRPNTINLE